MDIEIAKLEGRTNFVWKLQCDNNCHIDVYNDVRLATLVSINRGSGKKLQVFMTIIKGRSTENIREIDKRSI